MRDNRFGLVSLLVVVIVLLLVLLLGVGGWGAGWYYVRPSMTRVTPMQAATQTAVLGLTVRTPVPSELVANATSQAPAAVAQGTSVADLPLVSLSLSSDTIEEDGGIVTVTAHLSRVNETDVSVKLEFSGSATGERDDYTVSTDTIIIPAGSRSGNTLITAVGDTDMEEDETVVINIGSAVNAARGDGSQVTATIIQSDPRPLSLVLVTSPVTIMESGGQAHVTIVVSEPRSGDIGVTLSFAGSAEFGSDYYADTRFILIPAGSRTGTPAVITGLPDKIVEGEESILVSIESIRSESDDVYICGEVEEGGRWIPGDRDQLGSAALSERRAGCLVADFRTIIIYDGHITRGRSVSDVDTVWASRLS